MITAFLGYSKAERLRPEYYTGFFVFQAGHAQLRTGSMTGGGQIYAKEYRAFTPPSIMLYGAPLSSAVGSGTVTTKPTFLQKLFGGNQSSP